MHRVPATVVNQWKDHFETVKQRAKWIGRATAKANHSELYPFRDSEAARWKAEAAARARNVRKGLKNIKRAKTRQAAAVLPPTMGGHKLAHVLVGKALRWKCSDCQNWSASWSKMAPQKCSGKVSDTWANHRA